MSYCDRKLCSHYQEEAAAECIDCTFNNREFITGEGGELIRRPGKNGGNNILLDPDSTIPILHLVYSIMMMKQRMIEKYGDLED